MQGKIYLGIFALIGAGVGFSELDKSMNYVETNATVVSMEVDCFIKAGKRSVVVKETDDLAYMDCDMAPMVAVKFDHDESDIHKRAKIAFEYVSPVDGGTYSGDTTKEYERNFRDYSVGSNFMVYAHKEKPGKSRVN